MGRGRLRSGLGKAEVLLDPPHGTNKDISPWGVFLHHVSILRVLPRLQTNIQGGRGKCEGVPLEGMVCVCVSGLGSMEWVNTHTVWGMSINSGDSLAAQMAEEPKGGHPEEPGSMGLAFDESFLGSPQRPMASFVQGTPLR